MILLMLPALIALILKFAVMYWVDAGKQPPAFMALFVSLMLLNLCEVLAYIQFSSNLTAFWLVKAYYVICLFCIAFSCIYVMSVTQESVNSFVRHGFTAFAVVLSFILLFTDLMIIGTESIGYSLTAIHGPFYPLLRVVFLVQTGFVILILLQSVFRTSSSEQKVAAVYTLIAFSPMVVTTIGVNLAQIYGFKLSNSMLMPFATTLFLFLVCYLEPKAKLTRLRMYLPNSLERKLSNQIFDLATEFAVDGKPINDVKKELERTLLLYSLEKNDNVISHTADSIGLNRTSLYTAMKRLEIKRTGG
ncbi:helix-turn-helix domain-containing protein [Arenicella sp. 4NH20-0111]|uniref:helix-turn-helix domain-containing protein n=1 Tax=Arenicella sp. 4NH20-0111 TaxID=3127648 RepID=UPI00333E95BE